MPSWLLFVFVFFGVCPCGAKEGTWRSRLLRSKPRAWTLVSRMQNPIQTLPVRLILHRSSISIGSPTLFEHLFLFAWIVFPNWNVWGIQQRHVLSADWTGMVFCRYGYDCLRADCWFEHPEAGKAFVFKLIANINGNLEAVGIALFHNWIFSSFWGAARVAWTTPGCRNTCDASPQFSIQGRRMDAGSHIPVLLDESGARQKNAQAFFHSAHDLSLDAQTHKTFACVNMGNPALRNIWDIFCQNWWYSWYWCIRSWSCATTLGASVCCCSYEAGTCRYAGSDGTIYWTQGPWSSWMCSSCEFRHPKIEFWGHYSHIVFGCLFSG